MTNDPAQPEPEGQDEAPSAPDASAPDEAGAPAPAPPSPSQPGAGLPQGSLLALGFGTTVAMWAIAYACRLPAIVAPGWLLAAFFVVCLIGGGFLAGRWLPRASGEGALARALRGAKVSGVASLLNLLILGSVFRDVLKDNAKQAWLWVPGTLLLGALLGALGAALARAAASNPPRNWTSVFVRVAACATLLLLAAGGLVTSNEAGLAVPDWPNSFESNMFLYPLSRMTGGIYYEHAHRLFGSLVGLTTLVLMVHLQRTEERRWLRRLSVVAFVLVVVQGVMGGLRVTGTFTTSADPNQLAPSTSLAIAHGITGQLFFCLLVVMAAFVSTTWRSAQVSEPAGEGDAEAEAKGQRSRNSGTREAANLLLAALIVQLTLGAFLRHLHTTATLHITGALFVVLLAGGVGMRAWGLHKDQPVLPTLGKVLCGLVAFQFLLGWVAFMTTLAEEQATPNALADAQVAVTTLHQTTGALVIASAFLLRAWVARLLPGDDAAAPAAPA